MSASIAGDPADTNPSARLRADILAGLRIAEAGSIGDETPDELLDRYDALKRAEIYREMADRLAKHLGGCCPECDACVNTAHRMAASVSAATEAGESRG
ncbi:hypothetical protein [Streptomyces sp. NPDC048272]|uniref:hypothetical protein n=1 Tax=Streptomyces sp. NPDC048272 TaxID=3154616 RepID=UPI0034171F7F